MAYTPPTVEIPVGQVTQVLVINVFLDRHERNVSCPLRARSANGEFIAALHRQMFGQSSQTQQSVKHAATRWLIEPHRHK
jgi:hypothetical protein